MRIIVDTNIVISGIFFGGIPKKILAEMKDKNFVPCANKEIISEYRETIDEMLDNGKGKNPDIKIFSNFTDEIELLESVSDVKICRDPKDDKFINCAIDAKALYIVSGDKDLLAIKNFDEVEIVTAREFYEKYFI